MAERSDPRTKKARSLRRKMTLEERIVWSQIKALEIEGHFRRQVPIGPYFADFAHLGTKLIVEIDGGQHASPVGLKRDEKRSSYLEAAGFKVLRFWNEDVRKNRDGVVKTILATFNNLKAPHPFGTEKLRFSFYASPLPAMNGGRDAPSWTAISEPAADEALEARTSLPPLVAGRDAPSSTSKHPNINGKQMP